MPNKDVRSISEFNNELKLKGFKVFQIESDGNATRIYSRKDFCVHRTDIVFMRQPFCML